MQQRCQRFRKLHQAVTFRGPSLLPSYTLFAHVTQFRCATDVYYRVLCSVSAANHLVDAFFGLQGKAVSESSLRLLKSDCYNCNHLCAFVRLNTEQSPCMCTSIILRCTCCIAPLLCHNPQPCVPLYNITSQDMLISVGNVHFMSVMYCAAGILEAEVLAECTQVARRLWMGCMVVPSVTTSQQTQYRYEDSTSIISKYPVFTIAHVEHAIECHVDKARLPEISCCGAVWPAFCSIVDRTAVDVALDCTE